MKKSGRKKGSIPWNKGITRENDSRIARPWLNKERSPETIEKIKKTKHDKNFKHSDETKEKIAKSCKGRKLSDETKKKISEARQGVKRPELTGPNSRLWKGRNSRSIRKMTLLRDNGVCRNCGDKATEVDHIIPVRLRPDLFSDLNNTQSLCKKCHRKKTNADIKYIKSLGLRDLEYNVQSSDGTCGVYIERKDIPSSYTRRPTQKGTIL